MENLPTPQSITNSQLLRITRANSNTKKHTERIVTICDGSP